MNELCGCLANRNKESKCGSALRLGFDRKFENSFLETNETLNEFQFLASYLFQFFQESKSMDTYMSVPVHVYKAHGLGSKVVFCYLS